GYKGYSLFQEKDNELHFNDFSEVVALYEFDSNIKTLFYKHVMFAETAIKNRLLEIIHVHSGTELEKLFDNVLTDYKKHTVRSTKYKEKFKQTMKLRNEDRKSTRLNSSHVSI